MIHFARASRWYGQVIGLNDITCQIDAGITALLGPNGAGKSTFMKLVSGQLRPTTGKVEVLKERPFSNARVYRRLGYCPEVDSFYEDMTGREWVRFLTGLNGYSAAERNRRADESIRLVGMEPNADRRIGGYSKGMRQRIKLAQAVAHDPEVLLLDEPLNGLDPVGRREVTALIEGFAATGKCVVVSSHILHEVEQLTRRILLIHRGRLLAQGDLYRIRELIDRHPHRIALLCEEPRRLARDLLYLPFVVSARFDDRDPRRLEVETRDADAFYASLADLVLANDHVVHGFESPDNNLEAVFRYLTEQK
ncbi:MAG: ABC transporter ATP-binding protein [Armatimonadota bacterium]